MQAAELVDRVRAGAKVQVVRVGKDDVGAELAQLVGVDGLDGGLGADRHERGSRHVAVRRAQRAGASKPVRRGKRERGHEPRSPRPWVGLLGHPRSRFERSCETRTCL